MFCQHTRKRTLESGTHTVKLHYGNAKPNFHKDAYNYLKSKGIPIIR
jgi:hypothetical protein